MNTEHNEKTNNKSINEIELEAATNANFDSWTQGARDFCKGARKLVENLDDHSSLIFSDIFGQDVAKRHCQKLEEEAKHEALAGHYQAANHFTRRNFDYSRTAFGEESAYTQHLSLDLRVANDVDKAEALMKSLHANGERFTELVKQELQ